VDIGGGLAADIRGPRGLLVRFAFASNGWWTDDSTLLHLLTDTVDALPLSGYRLQTRAAVGFAIPAGPGELRASVGGVVASEGLPIARIEELYEDYGVAPPYLRATSLSGWVALEWEATVEDIRLQPHVQLEVGNEVGWRWRLAEDDLNNYTRNLDADVEALIAPGFGLSVPTKAPVGFRLDLLAGIEVSGYTASAAARGSEAQPLLVDTWTTLPHTEFFFHIGVGFEARIGRTKSVQGPEPERPRRQPAST
jgi:hypothetical protein